MRVAICIGTFHRPELLHELLSSISRLTFHRTRRPTFEVIVVDNDPAGSASEVCREARAAIPVRYVIESKRGIANVRNRAVQEAITADFIAFIDDDEIASPQWLDELLWVQARYGFDVVTGPVRPKFVGHIPEWVKKSKCFERPEFTTGTLLNKSLTGNVLISSIVFKTIPKFDERFQLTGGEDTHFFSQVHRAGFRIGWSQQALLQEVISPRRANLRWILHRGFQSGNSWVLSENLLCNGTRFRLARFCKSCVRVVNGLIMSIFTVFIDRGLAVRHLRQAFMGAGMFAALMGRRYQAYAASNPPIPVK
jgi:glycosyltransferase involved in cell wall biosynthesis